MANSVYKYLNLLFVVPSVGVQNSRDPTLWMRLKTETVEHIVPVFIFSCIHKLHISIVYITWIENVGSILIAVMTQRVKGKNVVMKHHYEIYDCQRLDGCSSIKQSWWIKQLLSAEFPFIRVGWEPGWL